MASLFRRSFSTLALACLAATLVLAGAALLALDRLYAEANARALEETARAFAAAFATGTGAASGGAAAEPAPASASAARLDPARARDWAARLASTANFRLTIVDRGGGVLADSQADPAAMENHAGRPEFAAALRGATASARRRSSTVGMELFYAAAPLPGGGALRVAVDLPSLQSRLVPARNALLAVLGLVLVLALGAAALWTRSVSRPLAALAERSKRLAVRNGAGPAVLSPRAPEEIRSLAAALEGMAAELAARAERAEAEGRERRAILDGMGEALLALDAGLGLRFHNPAAARLFGLDEDSRGKSLLSLTRSTELEALAREALGESRERKLLLPHFGGGTERWFQVHAAPLGAEEGVLLVLGEVTELKRLERIRRDFVANVSHELRTPVQLVKGFAENLRDGAIEEPELARRFVGIIERNASRMENLIADLLSLAALEQGERAGVATEETAILPLLEAARESLEPKAAAKGIELRIDCPAGLVAAVNPGLVEQALVNLVDNAVKYSTPGREVGLAARAEEQSLLLEVRDRGFGIPAADLPRIFERFYRVDKARSKAEGGTGLGLAIVRHIALAHGGEARVESFEGEGSRFELRLPLRAQPGPASGTGVTED